MSRLLAAAVVLCACSTEPAGREGVGIVVRAMTYNVAGALDESQRAQIAGTVAEVGADFVTVQEADDGTWLVERLPEQYELTGVPRAGVGVLFDSSRWALADSGIVALGENDDGWGPRYAQWGLFLDAEDRGIYVYSTHWCVTIRSTDDMCDELRQRDYADMVLDGLDPGFPAIVAGDLNVFDGFEHGPVVARIKERGLVDVFRSARPWSDGTTFAGNDWAPPGRVDYIFATNPVAPLDAEIWRGTTSAGDASDHYPVIATMSL